MVALNAQAEVAAFRSGSPVLGRPGNTIVSVTVLVIQVTVDIDTIVVVVMVLLILFVTLGRPIQGLMGSVRYELPLASSPPATLADGGERLSVRVRFPMGVSGELITTMLVFP